MNKYILGIDGMRCPMCESHVANAIRQALTCVSIKVSYRKGELIVICEKGLIEDDFRTILDATGYRIVSFSKTQASKALFGWR